MFALLCLQVVFEDPFFLMDIDLGLNGISGFEGNFEDDLSLGAALTYGFSRGQGDYFFSLGRRSSRLDGEISEIFEQNYDLIEEKELCLECTRVRRSKNINADLDLENYRLLFGYSKNLNPGNYFFVAVGVNLEKFAFNSIGTNEEWLILGTNQAGLPYPVDSILDFPFDYYRRDISFDEFGPHLQISYAQYFGRTRWGFRGDFHYSAISGDIDFLEECADNGDLPFFANPCFNTQTGSLDLKKIEGSLDFFYSVSPIFDLGFRYRDSELFFDMNQDAFNVFLPNLSADGFYIFSRIKFHKI